MTHTQKLLSAALALLVIVGAGFILTGDDEPQTITKKPTVVVEKEELPLITEPTIMKEKRVMAQPAAEESVQAQNEQISKEEFLRSMEERKLNAAQEKGPEAVERYYAQKEERAKREEKRTAQKEAHKKRNAEQKKWRDDLRKARELARTTGDSAEVERLMQNRPSRTSLVADEPSAQ